MTNTASPTPEPAKAVGRKKRVLTLLVVAAMATAASYWFILRPAPDPAPELGEVLVVGPLQVNLSNGHYLRIALALQMTADVADEVDGSRALDATISHYSGKPLAAVSQPKQRAQLKTELTEEILDLYEGELMDVYFTEFVTQ